MSFKKLRSTAALAGAVLATPLEAWPYVDPGAGSLLLQGILGTVAAGLALGSVYWRKLRGFFSRQGQAGPSKKR